MFMMSVQKIRQRLLASFADFPEHPAASFVYQMVLVFHKFLAEAQR
jgi:hypothetical protein